MNNITQFPRKMRPRTTVRVAAAVTPQISEAIDKLLWSGLYGTTRADVVSRLLSEGIVRCLVDGLVGLGDLRE